MRREMGDFQTPPDLVEAVLDRLGAGAAGWPWTRVLEPTCGHGSFVRGLLRRSPPPQEIRGIECQPGHVQALLDRLSSQDRGRVEITCGNLFEQDLSRPPWHTTGPLLVVGNPPWVTNSELGTLGSANLPVKSNLKGLRGLDALTGASNFDLAEFIWLKLICELAPQRPTIALLCKTSVARNVLAFAAQSRLPIREASLRRIDAYRAFGAAVEACLFCVEVGPAGAAYRADVYDSLKADRPSSAIGIVHGRLVASLEVAAQYLAEQTRGLVDWRQGLKHDAASVMELAPCGDGYQNRLGERVDVESQYVFPLFKSSDVYRKDSPGPRYSVIVPQRTVGEDTRPLERLAPRLWSYLNRHGERFAQRKSSIYQGRPPFSIFW
ncbi:MAG: SAM-dependent methyltransferase, partial [Armatimonadetes bacterium]|nr:SAM-dependent methyltransferase [Armatimonadota bacterium]